MHHPKNSSTNSHGIHQCAKSQSVEMNNNKNDGKAVPQSIQSGHKRTRNEFTMTAQDSLFHPKCPLYHQLHATITHAHEPPTKRRRIQPAS